MVSVKPPHEAPIDFSLLLGGPLFQLYRKLHLSGSSLELTVRRTVVVTLFAWAPLFLLSIVGGHAWGGIREPFLLDADVNVRLLFALPLLVGSESFVHGRVRTAVWQFIARGLVPGEARASFDRAVTRALRIRDSVLMEVVLLVLVYTVGVAVFWKQFAPGRIDTWYRSTSNGVSYITAAGYWYTLVSLPFFQFILLRWYFRLGIWSVFLWRVANCGLRLVPTHPDCAAGLGFLVDSTFSLVPFLLAHGALFAGVIAVGIFFGGGTLASYAPMLAAVAAFAIAVVLAPLLVFVVPLARVKRAARVEYGSFAQNYVAEFDQKWLRTAARDRSELKSASDVLVGASDIQGLADIIGAYQTTVEGMRLIPISPLLALRLAFITLLPVSPLLLTVMPARDIARMLVKGLF